MTEPLSDEEQEWAKLTYRGFIEVINQVGPTEAALMPALARVVQHVLSRYDREDGHKLIDSFAHTLHAELDEPNPDFKH